LASITSLWILPRFSFWRLITASPMILGGKRTPYGTSEFLVGISILCSFLVCIVRNIGDRDLPGLY
jgi:hypothetical protein